MVRGTYKERGHGDEIYKHDCWFSPSKNKCVGGGVDINGNFTEIDCPNKRNNTWNPQIHQHTIIHLCIHHTIIHQCIQHTIIHQCIQHTKIHIMIIFNRNTFKEIVLQLSKIKE